ncbi:MAG TPA: ABC transporter transmembrane domain-containing protein, partial [Archangium sp.]
MWWRIVARTTPFRGTLAMGIGASLFAATAGALWASLVGPLLRSLLAGGDITWGPFQLSQADLSWRLPLAIVFVAVLRALAAWLHSGLMSRVSQGVLGHLREELYGRLLSLPPKWFEQRHSGELLSRFTSDVAQLEFASGQALASVTKDVLQVV